VFLDFVRAAEVVDFQILLAFPNPTTGQFKVVLSGKPTRWVKLSAYNSIGQQVSNSAFAFEQGALEIALNWDALPSGFYWLSVENENEFVETIRVAKI